MFGRLKHYHFAIIFLISGFWLVSCRSTVDQTGHEAYLNKHISIAFNLPASIIKSKAVPYVDSVYHSISKPSLGDLAQVYDFKNKYYLDYEDDHDKAELYADSLLDLLKPHYGDPQYRSKYVMAYVAKGNTLYKQKYFSSAYEWYFLGKNLLSKDDTASYNKYMAQLNNSLAQTCYDQGRYKQAIRWYHECLNKLVVNADHENFKLKQGVLDNIGLCYRNLQRPDDAIKYFEKAVAVLNAGLKQFPGKEVFTRTALGLVYGNEGDAYLQKRNYKKAEELYRANIAINSQPNYLIADARDTKIKLASLYIKTMRYTQARQLLNEVAPVVDTTYKPEMLRWLKTNAEYYRNAPNEDATKAFDHLNKYMAVKDAAQAEMRAAASVSFNDQFSLLQQQYDLRSEERKQKLNNMIMFTVTLVGVLIAVITGSVLLKRSLTRRQVAPLRDVANMV